MRRTIFTEVHEQFRQLVLVQRLCGGTTEIMKEIVGRSLGF